jgi:cytochrome c553
MKCIAVLTIATIAVLHAARAEAQDTKPAGIAATCESCHGSKGDSTVTSTPRLNGQQAAYLTQRLHDFRDPTRQEPRAIESMWTVMKNVDDASIPLLAAYFASQAPTQAQNHGALAAKGRKIYAEGAPAQKVPSCQSCHGAHADGNGAIPRLAGQHAHYLTLQLESLRLSMRESDVMHPNTNEMTDDQINALVAYLAGN